MSDEDDAVKKNDGARPRKKQVTLSWQGAPLLLPGEDGLANHRADESGELTLPQLDSEPPARTSEPPPDESRGYDAWQRQRQSVTPPAFKPPSMHPPVVPAQALRGDAMSLVDGHARPVSAQTNLTTEMHDRYALGDYTAALHAAQLILGRSPDDRDAQMVSEASRERLGQLHGSRLGDLTRCPKVLVEGANVRWLGLDHRAGFLLSQVDGGHSLEELIDVSGMPRLEALKTLVELLDVGAIGFSD